MNTFSGFCISACLFMIFLGMASVVVNGLDIFPPSSAVDTTDAQGYFNDEDKLNDAIWIAGGILGAALVIVALAKGMTNLIGLIIFSTMFWASWLSINRQFLSNFFLDSTGHVQPAAAGLIAMLWLGMSVMFVGASIGLLSPGGTSMR